MQLHKTIASCFGIGYQKGGGTIAAIICAALWWAVQSEGPFPFIMLAFTIAITAIGIWSANSVESVWGVDSNKIVIDEFAGMCISLLFIPVAIRYVIIGLILFRFFDIVKPLFIWKAESLPAGWGVMADDVMAGFYTNLLLQVIVYYSIV